MCFTYVGRTAAELIYYCRNHSLMSMRDLHKIWCCAQVEYPIKLGFIPYVGRAHIYTMLPLNYEHPDVQEEE